MTTINNDSGRNVAIMNSQSDKVVGNGKTTVNNNGAAPSAVVDAAKPSSATGNVAKSAISDITKSTTSDILKSLFAEFTKDGKIDKGEINQLMQFMKLLGDLQAQKSDDAEEGDEDGGGVSGTGLPGTGGPGGSQAPPAGLPLMADGASDKVASGGESAAKQGPGSIDSGKPTAALREPDYLKLGKDLADKVTGPAGGKADDVNQPSGVMKSADSEGGPQAGRAEPRQEATEPNANASPRNASVSPSNSTDALTSKMKVDDDEDDDEDSDDNVAGATKGLTGGTAASRQTYASLKEAALSDGKISRNEQKALDNYAALNGIKDEANPAQRGTKDETQSQGPTPSPKGNLGQVLKDTMAASLKDGKISENEAKAISNLISAGAGKNLSAAEKNQMLTKFMQGAEKDGTFSNQDLKTFNKLLSLQSAGGSGTRAADAGGLAPTKKAPSSTEYMMQELGPYIYPTQNAKGNKNNVG